MIVPFCLFGVDFPSPTHCTTTELSTADSWKALDSPEVLLLTLMLLSDISRLPPNERFFKISFSKNLKHICLLLRDFFVCD